VSNPTSEDGGPLRGVRVLDCATLMAAPLVGTFMADYGADVIKIEHPRGDPIRSMAWQKEGVSLWWTLIARNKRCITLNLSDERAQNIFKRLAEDADVIIENFQPGTMERWHLGPEVLLKLNPKLVMLRTTGFGQTGPYRDRPGFGTLAESISGFAHINGWPDKPPALPPFALADGIAGLAGCMAVMFALWWRDHGGNGCGQVVDLSIYEPIFWLLGPQVSVYDQLDTVPGRIGNASPFTAPRNVYQANDGRWLGLSGSSQTIAERVMKLVGREDLTAKPWFRDHPGRVAHVDELDAAIQAWIGARTSAEVLDAFAEAQAAIAPIYSAADIAADPQYIGRESIRRFPHPTLGPILMQNLIAQLSVTPGHVAFLGSELGQHNEEIFHRMLGLGQQEIAEMKKSGVI
jgi:crotonobetainyl-CoA:carnitine CoA-transferase CaiB-like acyl-CoA transferase